MEPSPASPQPPGTKSAAGFFAALLVLAYVSIFAQRADPVLGLAWSEVFALLAPALVAAAGSNLRPVAYLRLGPARPLRLGVGLLAGAAGYLVASAIMSLSASILPDQWVERFDLSRHLVGGAWRSYAFAAVASVLAPVCEEAAFRGYLQSTLRLRRGPWPAILAGALLFAAIHFDPVRFPALVVLGALYGWMTWRAGSIWPAVVAHATNNAVASALFLALGRAEDAERARPEDAALLLAVGLGVLVPLLALYRVVTREPPPAESAVVLRDPARPSIAFSIARLPAGYVALWIAGVGALTLLLATSGP